MMIAIAASAGVPIQAGVCAITCDAMCGLISAPPSTVPRMIELTVVPSIQPLAATSRSAGSSSVRMPYFAGE
ncbi:hypothetical protein CSX04_03200 [Burkholderia cepacia]|nr:hypothetical protein CSX04_03200 [Burkholderia cepacia]